MSDLTRGQYDALIAMLSAAWSLDAATLRSLVTLGLVQCRYRFEKGKRVPYQHRLTEEGKRVAYRRLAETRQPGCA